MPHQSVSDRQRLNARKMRSKMTDAELKFWNTVRAHRLEGLPFRRQLPIGPYIVDFACPRYKLIVELDGVQHGEGNAVAYDAKRDAFLKQQGWHVERFWNSEILYDLDNVCSHLLAVIRRQDL